VRLLHRPLLWGAFLVISGCGGHVVLGGDHATHEGAGSAGSGGLIVVPGGGGSSGTGPIVIGDGMGGSGPTTGPTGSSTPATGAPVPFPADPICFRQGSYQATGLRINAIAYGPSGDRFATGQEGSPAVQIWDSGSAVPRVPVEGSGGLAYDVAFSPNGALLAAAGDVVAIWNPQDGRLVRKLPVKCKTGLSISFSHQGDLVATSCVLGDIQLWRVADGSLAKSIPYPTTVYSARFSPDDSLLVTGGLDNHAKIWRVSDGTEVLTLVGHNSAVSDAAFSPDGTEIATATYDDKALRIFRASDGALLQTLPGHTSYLAHAVWIDANHIVTNDWGGTVNLWVRGASGFALSCGFSAEGQSLGLAVAPRGPTILFSSTESAKRPAGLWTQSF